MSLFASIWGVASGGGVGVVTPVNRSVCLLGPLFSA